MESECTRLKISPTRELRLPTADAILTVEGHCYNVSSGYHQISLQLGLCEDDQSGDPTTGWEQTSQRLIVEEFHVGTNAVAGT